MPRWNKTLLFNVVDVDTSFSPDFLSGPSLEVILKGSDPTDPTQEGPIVLGSVTINPDEIVSPPSGAEGWWKLTSTEKRHVISAAQLKTEVVCVHPI